MEEQNWLQMLTCQQELQHFLRTMLPQNQKRLLTASELELLSRLYLQTRESTPLELSRESGMKKEAVSRCLKALSEKGLISKQKLPQDERSYVLTLTEQGNAALAQCYGPMLQPIYELKRRMGEEFGTLMDLVQRANGLMNTK